VSWLRVERVAIVAIPLHAAARDARRARFEPHGAALGEFHRVVDQILDRRAQPRRIADQHFGQIGGDRDASPGSPHAESGALKGAAVGGAVGIGVGIAASPLLGPAAIVAGAGAGAYAGSLVGAAAASGAKLAMIALSAVALAVTSRASGSTPRTGLPIPAHAEIAYQRHANHAAHFKQPRAGAFAISTASSPCPAWETNHTRPS